MKSSRSLLGSWFAAWVLLALPLAASAAPYLAIFGGDAENKVYHFFIDESAGETNSVSIEFWPNEAADDVELYSNLNRRDFATLSPPDANLVSAEAPNPTEYWRATNMVSAGAGKWTLTAPIHKCGAYDITVRYRQGAGAWKWYTGRNAAAVVSDVATRDLVVYEMQAHVVDATGNDFASRSTFPMLHDGNRFDVNYLANLGVNTIWLQPFHPIGAKSDCNTGDPGSPYSIKNLFEVAEYLSPDNTRTGAMAAFQTFVNAADTAGVKIISDVIFNHVSTDVEIARDPANPANPWGGGNPFEEMRNVRPQWFSRYLGGDLVGCPTDKNGLNTANFHWGEPALSGTEIGPAPADRHDFMWPDAYDLFWGTYPALGDINNTADNYWNTSTDVKQMVDYYAYFLEHWINQTGGKMGGFRCDFAQGIPRQAWQYLINKAKSIKPELYFVAESLDGGNIAYRAWKGGFDCLNENQLWAIVQNNDIKTTDLRSVFDSRKSQYGYALILRGTINHDQGPWINRKWDAMAMHGVFCAMDGTPQLYQGQELGYDQPSGQFSRTRVEFGREIPDIRNWHNIENLWNDADWDHDHLWNRYKDANKGRANGPVLRLANQYYLDQVNNAGPHQHIFSVLKYENYGWDAADQDVVLGFVNLRPFESKAGTFNVNVPAIHLNPTKTYNVRNLASSNPNTYLWAQARSGSDIAANGIYVGFSGNVSQEGAVTQFLKLEEVGGGTGGSNVTFVGNTTHYPPNGQLDAGEDLWIDTESYPQGAANFGSVLYSSDGGATWDTEPLAANGTQGNNDKWHANLGPFAAGQTIQYSVEIVDNAGSNKWDNNGGVNYSATVNSGTSTAVVQWAGNTRHWPTNGAITSTSDLWVDIESWPQNTAIGGDVVYSSNGGVTWQGKPLTFNTTVGNNDWWHANLGQFPAGTTIEFAVKVEDGFGTEIWDNNGGTNYEAVVNGSGGGATIQWVGNTKHAAVLPPMVADILHIPNGVQLNLEDIKNGAQYQVLKSSNALEWATAGGHTGAGNVGTWTDNAPPVDVCMYALQGTSWPFSTTVYEGDHLVIRIETYPQGRAVTVTIVYSSNGVNWQTTPMVKIGTGGNNDIWEVDLGEFPHGINIQYAIEVVDDNGVATWDNNGYSNFHVSIVDPNAPDTTPPVLSHSPSNTTTSAATLDVSLSATDDFDPSPAIYYTTNGDAPTTNSAVYAGVPIHATNVGAGVDMTIKAFARDATGNQSLVKSIDVKVSESFQFGGTKPYSLNPTLGQAVANGGITIDGNFADWNDAKIIALDMANDYPATLQGNWTLHETARDFSHLWAAWDDNYLYLAYQFVDVRDKIDAVNSGSGDHVTAGDGVLHWIAIDTIQGQGARKDVWSKNGGNNYWTGVDVPDYQVYLFANLVQSYISRAVNGVFALDDGGVNYAALTVAGGMAAKSNTFADNELWGVGDTDDRNQPAAPNREFIAESHATSRDGFYEVKIPLSWLQITRSQLESNGIGVMMGVGGTGAASSCMDSIPHDETTLDTPGVEGYNSSLEWGDVDSFTTPFARVGAGK